MWKLVYLSMFLVIVFQKKTCWLFLMMLESIHLFCFCLTVLFCPFGVCERIRIGCMNGGTL